MQYITALRAGSRRLCAAFAAVLLLSQTAPLAQAAPLAYVLDSYYPELQAFDTAPIAPTPPVYTNPSLPSPGEGLAVSPNGQWIYLASQSASMVAVLDSQTGGIVGIIPVGSYPSGIAVSPDGRYVYAANSGSNSVSVIDTTVNAVVATVPVGNSPEGVAVSPDGRHVYVTSNGDDTVSVIDTATNTVSATVPVGAYPEGVAVTPNGRWVYVANNPDDTVSVINAATNTVVATVPVGQGPFGVAANPNGEWVYVTNEGGTMSMIDTQTRTVLGLSPTGLSYPTGVAVTPDGTQVYVANLGNGMISVIDAGSLSSIYNLSEGGAPYNLGNFIGPGTLIASNANISGNAGQPIYGNVPTLNNPTGCAATDGTIQTTVHGSVTLGGTGAFSYAPNSITYSGPDAFTWRGQASSCPSANAPNLPVSNTATESITINPQITGLTDITLGKNSGQTEPFTLQGSPNFTYTVSNDNPGVLSSAKVLNAYCGTSGNLNCLLYLSTSNTAGTAHVTITAKDKYGDTTKKTIAVTVPTSPTISGFSNLSITGGQNGVESLTITGTGTLTVSAYSSNQTLLPDSRIAGTYACTNAGNCTITVTPIAGQLGTAAISVQVTDNYGGLASGSFTINVTDNAPTANNGALSTSTDTAASGNLSASNPDSGQTLTYSIVTQPAHGTVTITNASTGAFTYTPATGYAGSDSFTFKANDGYKDSNTATESIAVSDNPPTASNGSYSTTTGTAVNGTLNASDPDSGQTLTYSIAAQPTHGTVTITNASTGAFTYTPATGYAGSDSFTFKANDGYKDSNTATESITVSDNPPTASNGSYSTTTGTAVNGTLNASDPDSGQTLTYSIAAQPAHGTVTITNASTGAFTYTPATGYAGSDSFTFKANDGYKDSNTATVSITVSDNPPAAGNGSFSTSTDTAVNGTLNASDPNPGQTLTWSIVTQPAHGSISLNAGTGAVTYTPATGYAGSDSFTFRVYDGYKYSNTATVAVTVADNAPTAVGASLKTSTGQSISGQLTGNTNDAGQTLAFALAQAPAHGSVTLNADGSFTYAPATGYAGSDAFTFIVNDGYLNSVPATVSITVNDGVPSAANATFSTPIDKAYSGQLKATNPNTGQTLTFSIVTGPAHGKVSLDAGTGAFTYTPTSGYLGNDSFTFKANDGYQDSNTATVSASVTDTAPVVQKASYTLGPNKSVSGQLKATASNPSQTLTYAVVNRPAHGTVSLDPSTGNFTYIPDHDYVGKDQFTFKASDGTLDSNPAPITLTVTSGALAVRGGAGGGAVGPWTLTLLAGLALLITLLRRQRPTARGTAGRAALAGAMVLVAGTLLTAIPARAAGPWYAGLQANIIKPAGGRNSATGGMNGWTALIGRHLGQHFAVEFERAYYSDNPRTLTATANWVNWSLRGLYFPWQSQGAFAPFLLAGLGHQYQYRGDNSEPSDNSASLGLGFTSRPWSAPVAIRAEVEAQHGFGGGYTDRIASIGVVFGFGASRN